MKEYGRTSARLIRSAGWLAAIAVLILFTSGTPGQDGVEQVRDIFKSISKAPHEDAVVHVNYTVRATLSEMPGVQVGSTSVSVIDVLVGKDRSRYTSNELVYYQDEVNSFTVIPSRKTIYWADSNMKGIRNKRQETMSLMQDTLLSMCTVAEYKMIDGKEEYDRRIVLVPRAAAKKSLPVKRLTYYLSGVRKTLYKVIIDHPDGGQFENTEMVYNTIDMDYKQADMSKPAKSFFIQGKDQLLPAYKGYKLVDNRKKKQ